MGLLIIILYPLFVSLVLGEIVRVQLPPDIGIRFLDVCVGIVAVGLIIHMLRRRKILFPKMLLIPLILLQALFILSLLVNIPSLPSQAVLPAFFYQIRFFAYCLLFSLPMIMAKKEIKKMRELMLLSGAGLVIVGFIQYFFFNNLKVLFHLGWDDHLYRLFSTFLDPNFAGMFFVLFFLFLMPYIYRLWQKEKGRGLYFSLSLALLTFLAIILTYSRTAYITLFIGVLLFLLLQRRFAASLIAGSLILISVFLFANTKIEGLNPFRTASTIARVESIENAVTIFRDHPLVGVGFNAYRYAQIEYHFRQEETRFPTHADSGTDNSFLFILATTGVLGFGTFSYFLYSFWRYGVSSKKEEIFRHSFSVQLICWCIGSFFINGLFYPPLLFWMIMSSGITEESL